MIDVIGDDAALGHCWTHPGRKWLDELDKGFRRMPAFARRRLEAEIMSFWAGFLAEQMYVGDDSETAEVGFGIDTVDQNRSVVSDSDIDKIVTLAFRVTREDNELNAYVDWLRYRTTNETPFSLLLKCGILGGSWLSGNRHHGIGIHRTVTCTQRGQSKTATARFSIA